MARQKNTLKLEPGHLLAYLSSCSVEYVDPFALASNSLVAISLALEERKSLGEIKFILSEISPRLISFLVRSSQSNTYLVACVSSKRGLFCSDMADAAATEGCWDASALNMRYAVS